jgi:hypothetical protein
MPPHQGDFNLSGLHPAATLIGMGANKKPQRDSKGDRHKPSKMFRVPTPMAELLEELGREEIGSSATEQLKIAIREYLQRKGKIAKPAT